MSGCQQRVTQENCALRLFGMRNEAPAPEIQLRIMLQLTLVENDFHGRAIQVRISETFDLGLDASTTLAPRTRHFKSHLPECISNPFPIP